MPSSAASPPARSPRLAQLDLLDVAATRADPRIKQALADRDAALAKDPDPLAPFRVALEGGDVRAGMKVFRGNPVMQCVRCHSVGDEVGGEAGPNLAGVAARGSREYILESIIKPSAKFAAGFEIVTVNRVQGPAVIGTLVKRDASGVQVKTSDATVDIPAADLKSVESAPLRHARARRARPDQGRDPRPRGRRRHVPHAGDIARKEAPRTAAPRRRLSPPKPFVV
ncbi:MAG: c-type cytochrome [Lacunisphaera sp.]